MGYAYDESPFVPFNTPQVGPTVPSLPAPEMRDAEIAKLREERAIHLASIAEHSKQLAAARAALKVERSRALTEAATYAFCLDWSSDPRTALAKVWHWLRSRAAEAKGEPK